MEVTILYLSSKNNLYDIEQFKWFDFIIKQSVAKQFVAITDKPTSFQNLQSLKNLQVEYFNPSRILPSFFSTRKIMTLIVKHKAKVLISINSFVKLKNSTPQVIFLQQIPSKKESFNLIKSNLIIVFTDYFKNILVKQFLLNENQIEVIPPIISSAFKPLSFNEISSIKDGYTDGRNFFICNSVTSESEELITILKAFAQFKKWQKTNMKLMVVSRHQNLSSSLQQKISTFKFKDDVVVLENISDEKYAQLLAASYALIHITNNPLHIFPLVEAIQTNTALISSNNHSFKEIIAEAALLVKENTTEEIANAIQELYKNESLRSKLIEQASLNAKDRNIEHTVHYFWQIIQKAIQV